MWSPSGWSVWLIPPSETSKRRETKTIHRDWSAIIISPVFLFSRESYWLISPGQVYHGWFWYVAYCLTALGNVLANVGWSGFERPVRDTSPRATSVVAQSSKRQHLWHSCCDCTRYISYQIYRIYQISYLSHAISVVAQSSTRQHLWWHFGRAVVENQLKTRRFDAYVTIIIVGGNYSL